MILYHGTTKQSAEVICRRGFRTTDFGKVGACGVPLTKSLETAFIYASNAARYAARYAARNDGHDIPVVIGVEMFGGHWFDARGMGGGPKLTHTVALALGYDTESQKLYFILRKRFPLNTILSDYDGVIIDSTIPTRDNEPEYIWFKPDTFPRGYIEMGVEARAEAICGS